MATNDCYRLSLKSKEDLTFGDTLKNEQYNNLNLNQSHQNSSDAFFENSKNVSFEKGKALDYEKREIKSKKGLQHQKCVLDFANHEYPQKYSHSWNSKSTKDLPLNFAKNGIEKEKDGLNKWKNSSIKNSTLSLHIFAYENLTQASSDLLNEPNGMNQKQQVFTDLTSVIQNPFEFPRQQKNVEAKMPEIAQFKATQRLLSPNQMNRIKQQPIILQRSAGSPGLTSMAYLSKLAPAGGAIARLTVGKLRPQALAVQAVRLSHAHLFRRRNGQLIVNRIKDMAHFYMIALGSLPFLFACAYTHIVYGPCELKDYPEDGPPPRYWQFERTPLRQFWAKYFGVSDMEHHERNLAYFERQGILSRWRRTEDRVKHLQGEFADYKGYFYMPVSAQWIDYGRYMANRQRDQYESHASYAN